MTWNPTSPVVGATGFTFTSPTYTLTSAQAANAQGRKFIVSNIGGTQTGVRAHAANDPFETTCFVPANYRSLVLGPDGSIKSVPFNRYQWQFRKGLLVVANQPPLPANARLYIDLPAGSESADAPNINALMCFIGGIIADQANEMADTLRTQTA